MHALTTASAHVVELRRKIETKCPRKTNNHAHSDGIITRVMEVNLFSFENSNGKINFKLVLK